MRLALGLPLSVWAGYLGVSVGALRHLEAGRRPGTAAWPRLARLLPAVPPPWGTAPPDPPALSFPQGIAPPALAPVAPPPPAALAPPLARRPLVRALRQATLTAANLRADLLARPALAARVARQQAALALLTAPPLSSPLSFPLSFPQGISAPAPDRHPARTQRLIEALRLEIEIGTGPGTAPDPARRAHDELRLWLLETEAAALAAWLAQAPPPAP